MKYLFILIITFFSLNVFAENSIYELEATTIKGKKLSFSTLKGKTILVVNIASRCGFTPQLQSLQELYEKYRQKGLVVIGVPSNEFGGQTPEADQEMAKFCKLNYGVNFPLLSKTNVRGDNKHPLFKFLLTNSKNKDEISWNFEKFLISKNGDLVSRFRSGDSPLGKKVTGEINKILN